MPAGDLDWIVLKALAKDRRQRYDSALDFARDVQRYMSGEAVEAHPPSFAYKSWRWLSRHKALVTSAGLVTLAILVGIAGLLIGLRRSILAERDTKRAADALAANVATDLVQGAWKAASHHDYEKASRLLDSCPTTLRGWEWRLVQGQLQQPLFAALRAAGGSPIRAMDFDPGYTRVAYTLDDGQVEVRSLADGKLLHSLPASIDAVAVDWCASSPNSPLVIGLSDGEIRTYQTDNWKSHSHRLGLGAIYDIDTSKDGKTLIACTGGGWAIAMDVPSLEFIRRWKLPARAASLTFLNDQQFMAAGLDGRAYLLKLDRDEVEACSIAGSSLEDAVALAAGGFVAISASQVFAKNLHAASESPLKLMECRSVASALTVDAEDHVWVGCGNGNLMLYANGQQHAIADFGIAVIAIRVLAPSHELVVALSDGRLLRGSVTPAFLDRSSATATPDPLIKHVSKPLRVPKGSSLPASSYAAVAGGANGKLLLMDLKTKQVLAERAGHRGAIWALSTAADAPVLVSVGEDRYLRCWELPELRLRFEHKIDLGVRAVSISPNGEWIAAAPELLAGTSQSEGTIAIWDALSGAVVQTLKGHQNWVLQMAISADGSRLISTCEDRETRVWDRKTGKLLAVITPENKAPAEHLALDASDQKLYLGHRDGWITSWDLSSGESLAAWPAYGDAITGLAVTKDGRVLATSRSDERLQIVNAELKKRLGEFDMRVGYIAASQLSRDDEFMVLIGPASDLNVYQVAP